MSKPSVHLAPHITLKNCVLTHAGVCNAEKKDFIPNHFHGESYEFTACFHGKGTCYTGDKPTTVQKGDIYVSFPYDYHKIESDTTDYMSYVFVTFNITDGHFAEDFRKTWQDNIPDDNRVFQNDRVRSVIEKVIDELQNKDTDYHGEILSALMDELMVYILRSFKNKSSALPSHPSPEELCQHLCHYIDTHIFTMNGLSEAAVALGYNYSYLSAIYKRTTGKMLASYYLEKRMQAAEALLLEEMESVTDIAEKIGYADIYSFSKAFRQYFGCSPKSYVKRLKEKNIK